MRFLLALLTIAMLCAGLSANLSAIDVNYTRGTGYISLSGDFELNKINDINYKNQVFNSLEISDCKVSGQNGYPQIPVYSKLIALPNTGNFSVDNFNFENEIIELNNKIVPFGFEDNLELSSEFSRSEEWYPAKQVVISDPIIMRGIRFAQVSVYPMQYNIAEDRVRILKSVNLDLSVDSSININEKTRETEKPAGSFGRVARSGIIGNEICETDDTGMYLFICPDIAVEEITRLAKWKNRLGHEVKVTPISETGTTNVDIKAYLQDAYDNWEVTPEYVVLVGDIDGTYTMPTFYKDAYLGNTNETDHTYALLDGTDYFPDVFIGRISIQNSTQLTTVVNKIINYESNPYIGNDWQSKAIMCTYVNSYYTSSRETVMEIREKMLDYSYTVVDTFISPYQNGQITLRNKINSGYSFVNYRGAGGPAYWVSDGGIMFEIDDINALNNGFMLPFVTGIVCGGGDFGDNGSSWTPGYDNCFGETWLNAGNPSLPKGGIGFIGPSEHDTKTPFNNANDAGIYQGITREGLNKGGEMLLRGKIELYNNYPNMHEWGLALDSDQFYFYVYNLLGDPGLPVWTDVPQSFDYQVINTPETTSNHLEILIDGTIPDKAGFVVVITRTDDVNINELVAVGLTDENGTAVIPCGFVGTGFNVTVSKAGFIPQTYELDIAEASNIALTNFELQAQPTPGSTIAITSAFKNVTADTASDINITVSCDDDEVIVSTEEFIIASLDAEASSIQDIYVNITDAWKDGFKTVLQVNVSSSLGTQEFMIPLEFQAPELTFSSLTSTVNNILPQGGSLDINIELSNSGSLTSGTFDVILESLDELVTIDAGNSSYEEIALDGLAFAAQNFQVTVNEDAIDGEAASFMLTVLSSGNEVQEVFFSYPVGTVTSTSPTLSSYGYMGIESTDEVDFAPEYEWIGIAPAEGGQGNVIYGNHSTVDGFSKNLILPFDFQYYGETYDRVAVCSNGYLSFREDDYVFHRNRIIPSGVGPAGMIAPFWDNLFGGNIYSYYDSEENIYIVEWYHVRNMTNQSEFSTFQVILYDPAHYGTDTGDGVIKFQYKEIHNVDYEDNYATIGIENYEQNDGVLIGFDNIDVLSANEVADETAILFTTSVNISTDADDDIVAPGITKLTNYPNPFNPTTTISFSLKTEITKNTEIEIYNVRGQKIKSFICRSEPVEGLQTHSVIWNGTDRNNNQVSSGIYFATLKADNKTVASRKMLLMK